MQGQTNTTPLSIVLVGLVSAGLAGCASVPKPLEGEYPPLTSNQVSEHSIGTRVRWGGEIVTATPQANQTCIEVLSWELDNNYRPSRSDDRHYGRFLACREGFQDPAIYAPGRELTVIGSLTGFRDGTVGEFVYRYPVVATETIHLWPEQMTRTGLYDPLYGPRWSYYYRSPYYHYRPHRYFFYW